ncbi:interleukin-5 receptor subunit alpha isoform X2 [Xenopus laevis]|uniref:Interleukin-5 receptor subunit alpha isoform X2 n=1 Tax=Xenopus laevis TaxID=8355 RepID=A0A8J0UCR2_XENLA|nr:interleukin-5 receptor subunit alpha isoform X2 [Xenopus laevis]
MTCKYNLILGITVVAIHFIFPQAEDSCEKQQPTRFPKHHGKDCPKSSGYITNVSCQIYNLTNLNCTWGIKDIQSCFFFWIKGNMLPCSQYLKNEENKIIGCHMKVMDFEEQPKARLHFFNTECQITKAVKLSDIEMMKPPINITKESQKGKVIMKWSRPPTATTIVNSACFEYELKVLETETNVLFRTLITDKKEHTFHDLDKNKRYSIRIRGRKRVNCGQSKFWGEWSKPLFVGKGKKSFPSWIFPLTFVIVMVFTFVISLFLLKRFAWTFFTAVIPDPSSKLKFWFSSSDLYFQCADAAQHECVPISEIEIVTSSMDSTQCGQGH